MIKIGDITAHLETIAPPSYQESYDNAGLITGHPNWEAKGALCCLDATEAVVDEAISKGCNLVVAHHPIVFKGLKKLNGNSYVERTVIKAIRHEVAIYAIHTNLDNVLHRGVNSKIAERLGLVNTRILAPKALMKKLTAWVVTGDADKTCAALLTAGASYVHGVDGWEAAAWGNGWQNRTQNPQVKLELAMPSDRQTTVLKALQQVAPDAHFEISGLENPSMQIGSGMIGELAEPLEEMDFLKMLKETMNTKCIRYTRLRGQSIKKVALCGGAGSFLLQQAIGQKADVFITGDFKYHEFFDAEGRLVIADIGHYESEQFTIDLLHDIILEKFPTFAPLKTALITNPVNYL